MKSIPDSRSMTRQTLTAVLSCLLALQSLLIGCRSSSVKQASPQRQESLAVYATPMGLEMQEARPGDPVEVLSEPGDRIVLKMGDRANMIFDNINPETESIETVIDDEAGTVTLSVVDRRLNIIRLTQKCQTVERVGSGPLPAIEVGDGLRAEQIIITPLCDDERNIVGYSVRYGSEERGCGSQARAALRAFGRCNSDEPKATKRKQQREPWEVLFRGQR